MSDDDFKTMFPNLASDGPLCESYLYLTVAEVARANLKQCRDKVDKKSTSFDGRLRDNEKTITKGAFVLPLWDDCKSKIHPLRFDRTPLISSTAMFIAAAEYYADKELLPTNAYDLSAVQMTNVITNKGVEEAHKPYSREISIKQFTRENHKKSSGGMATMSAYHDDCGRPTMLTSLYLGDIENIKQFHEAFFNLYIFKGKATPWDKSLDPLWKFFWTHDWFVNNPNSFGFYRSIDQGTFNGGFTDRILHSNADRFLHKAAHLVLHEIDSEFKGYCISNIHCSIVQMVAVSTDKVSSVSTTQNKSVFKAAAPGSTFISIKTICKNFNSPEGCTNKFDNSTRKCRDTRSPPGSYLHICNFKMASQKPCGQTHSIVNHN